MTLASLVALSLLVDGPAEVLHERALTHYRARQYAAAIPLWRSAYALSPSYKYGLNTAKAWHALARTTGSPSDALVECWRWLERVRAETLERTPEELPALSQLDECEAQLKLRAALVRVAVPEPGLTVMLDGESLEAPWLAARDGQTARLSVRRGADVLEERDVALRVGNVTLISVSSQTPPVQSVLTVEPPPPSPPVQPVEPGPKLAASSTLEVGVWGWSTLGAGVALVAVGGGLVGHAFSLQGDLQNNNDAFAEGHLDRATYDREFSELEEEQAKVYPAGLTLLGVGAAAVVTGAVLLWLAPSEQPAVVLPMLSLDGQVGLSARF